MMALKKNSFLISSESDVLKKIFDSVDYGLILINRDGKIKSPFSSACDRLFERPVAGMSLAELTGSDTASTEDVLGLLFNNSLSLDSLIELLPEKIFYQRKILSFSYKPLVENALVQSLLCCVLDITAADTLAEGKKIELQKNSTLIKILNHKIDFVEALELVENLKITTLERSFEIRKLHTLKGLFAYLECFWLAEICTKWEKKMADSEDIPNLQLQAYAELQKNLHYFLVENEKVLNFNFKDPQISISINTFSEAIRDLGRLRPHPEIYKNFDSLMLVPLSVELNGLSDAYIKFAEKLGKVVSPISFDPNDKIPTKIYKELFNNLIPIIKNCAAQSSEDESLELNLDRGPGILSIKLESVADFYHLKINDSSLHGHPDNPLALKKHEAWKIVLQEVRMAAGLFVGDFTTQLNKDRTLTMTLVFKKISFCEAILA